MIGRVAYLIDVRSEEEYAEGHIPGSINVPGGQAVQRADDFVAVRNAPVVFISNDAARAVMTAYWYGQMGFPNVAVLEGGLNKWSGSGEAFESGSRSRSPLGFKLLDLRAAHRC
jgi:rhodanese-related sulfurtransferase